MNYNNRVYSAGLEEHATALGYYCFQFASLELALDRFLQDLLQSSDPVRRVIVTYGGQFSNRCSLAKALIYAVPDLAGTDWRAQAEAILNHATGALSSERNRLIHDPWIDGGDEGAIQWNEQAKVAAPQAREPKALLPVRNTTRTVQGIWDAGYALTVTADVIHQLALVFRLWQQPTQRGHTQTLLDQSRMALRQVLGDGHEEPGQPPQSPPGSRRKRPEAQTQRVVRVVQSASS